MPRFHCILANNKGAQSTSRQGVALWLIINMLEESKLDLNLKRECSCLENSIHIFVRMFATYPEKKDLICIFNTRFWKRRWMKGGGGVDVGVCRNFI